MADSEKVNLIPGAKNDGRQRAGPKIIHVSDIDQDSCDKQSDDSLAQGFNSSQMVKQQHRDSVASLGSQRHTVTKVKFSEIERTKSGGVQFKTTPYRWAIMFVFCSLFVNLCVAIVGFSSYIG